MAVNTRLFGSKLVGRTMSALTAFMAIVLNTVSSADAELCSEPVSYTHLTLPTKA